MSRGDVTLKIVNVRAIELIIYGMEGRSLTLTN